MIRLNQWGSNDWMFFFSWTYGPALDSDLFVEGHLRSHHQEALFTWARSRREENPEARCALHILHESLHITIPNDTILWNQKRHRFPQKKLGGMFIPDSWKMRCEIMYILYTLTTRCWRWPCGSYVYQVLFPLFLGMPRLKEVHLSVGQPLLGKHICSNILPVPQEVLYGKIHVTSILFQALTGENPSTYVLMWPKSIKPLFDWKYLSIHHYPSIYFNYPPLKLTVRTWK